MNCRLMSSRSASSSTVFPVFLSRCLWYPAAEALEGESARESFMNWSLSSANFFDAAEVGIEVSACCAEEWERSMSINSTTQESVSTKRDMGFAFALTYMTELVLLNDS